MTIMQDMKSSSVDLIYLDPPFNSNQAYDEDVHILHRNGTEQDLVSEY